MLVFEHVSKRFGGTEALRGVSLRVKPGTVVGLVGHNGAGKSTLMRMAVRLVRPDAGRVVLGGEPVERLGRLGGLVAASFDASALPAHWSATTAVRVTAELSGVPAGRVAAVLDVVGLADAAGKRIGQFSMGMRQRLAVALALVAEPRVLILDEPTNALDPVISHDLRGWVAEHAARGNCVLISSHNLPEVEQVADRIVVMHKGEVVRDAAHADLRRLVERRDRQGPADERGHGEGPRQPHPHQARLHQPGPGRHPGARRGPAPAAVTVRSSQTPAEVKGLCSLMSLSMRAWSTRRTTVPESWASRTVLARVKAEVTT